MMSTQPFFLTKHFLISAIINDYIEKRNYCQYAPSGDGTNIFLNADPIFGGELMKVTNFFKKDKYPFVASIGTDDESPDEAHFCTGVLISRRHVLTAAHCELSYSPDIRIFLGSEILEKGKLYRPISFVTYADWAPAHNNQSLYNDAVKTVDLGVITLSEDVDKAINHASFSDKRETDLYNTQAYFVGWSANKMEDNRIHKYMIPLKTINRDKPVENEGILKKFLVSTPRERCLGTTAIGDVYLNEGDSGGPLFDQDNRLVAILAGFLYKKDDKYSPSSIYFHTLIYPHVEFINHFIHKRLSRNRNRRR